MSLNKKEEPFIFQKPVCENKEKLYTISKNSYECPKHGIITNHITSTIEGIKGTWCLICIIEKLDDLGVSRLTKIKS